MDNVLAAAAVCCCAHKQAFLVFLVCLLQEVAAGLREMLSSGRHVVSNQPRRPKSKFAFSSDGDGGGCWWRVAAIEC